MELDAMKERLSEQTTRRRIVKTGVKVAYAAPIVAATFKLSDRALAQQVGSPPPCNGGTCGAAERCEENSGECVCFQTVRGGFCHRCERCSTADRCPNGQSDCDALGDGSVCDTLRSSCCRTGDPICMQPCAGTTSNCFGNGFAQVRVYDVAAVGNDSSGFESGSVELNCGNSVCW